MTKNHLKKCKKNDKGITLIALIITIIVLLILAGITINALTGSDSAPAKANEAKQKNDIGVAKEQVFMIAQNAQNEAYESVYVKGKKAGTNEDVSALDASGNVGDYVKAKVYEKFPESENKKMGVATIKAKANGKITIRTRDFSVTGKISDLDGVLTWKEVRSVTTAEGTPITSAINNSNYGDYINLDTDILDLQNITLSDGTHPSADWRIFHKDEAGVWVILSDYMPYDKMPSKAVGDKKLKQVGTTKYCVNASSRDRLLYALTTDWYWMSLTDKGTVQGAVPSDVFIDSYNTTHPNDTRKFEARDSFGIDNLDTLYLPHNSSSGEQGCKGYWLQRDYGSFDIWCVNNGTVFMYSYESEIFGIRPVVYLGSDVKVAKEGNGSLWTVVAEDDEDENENVDITEVNVYNYGDYVNLDTNILDLSNITLSDGTHPTTDWRIMYKDTTGVWLILSDYMPFDIIPSEATGNDKLKQVGTKVYSVRSSSNENLVNTLETESNWSSLTDKGIVKGAVPTNVLFASHNQAYPGDTMTFVKEDRKFYFDKTDTLYIPHNSSEGIQGCKGYWLPDTFYRPDGAWCMKDDAVDWFSQGDMEIIGVRPAVFIDTSTKQLVKKANSSVWTVE